MNSIKRLASERYQFEPLNILRLLVIFSFFLFFFISLLKIDLHDYDFWWHLATGKYIIENKSLPDKDPFTYTTKDTHIERKSVILKGYWLGQVVFYKVYSQWNLKGIIILRSLLMVIFLFFAFMTIKKQTVSELVALIFTAVIFLIQRSYSGERPHLFTFTIFSIIFYLLEDYRINRSRKVYLIPILVMILSNMHPGYVVCIMLVTLYLIGEGVRYLFNKAYKDGIFRGLLILWVITVIFSMLNPNGALMLKLMFYVHGGEHIKGIVEFQPTFYFFLNKIVPLQYPYIAFLLLSLLGLGYIKRIGTIHVLLLLIFTIMSFVAIRYVIFYMCISAPILAGLIVNLQDRKMFRWLRFLKRNEGLLYLTACITGIFMVFTAIPSFAKDEYRVDTAYYFTEGVANFLSNVEIEGNMFNDYGQGGYLIWRLYPDKKVFIDGRALEPEVYKDYQKVINLSKEKGRSWEDMVEKYNISYFVLTPLFLYGDIPSVIEELFINKDWVLIYADHLSLVFIKNDARNTSVIKKYAMDKVVGLNTIIVQTTAHSIRNKVNPYFLLSLGKVFFIMGRLDDAEKALTIARERAPDNAIIKFWIEKVKDAKNK